MIAKYKSSLTLLFAILFAILFYNKLIGLNLILFEFLFIIVVLTIHNPRLKSKLVKLMLIGTFVSLAMVLLHNSSIAKTVNIVSFITLIGSIIFPDHKLISNYSLQFLINIRKSIPRFFNTGIPKLNKWKSVFRYFKIIVVPIIIIIVFLVIYYNSNSYFAQLFDQFFDSFFNFFNWLPQINVVYIIYLIVGFLLAANAFYAERNLILNASPLSYHNVNRLRT